MVDRVSDRAMVDRAMGRARTVLVRGVILPVLGCLMAAAVVAAQEAGAVPADRPPVLTWSADARLGYFGSRTQGRNGTTDPWRDVFASRVRLGAAARFAPWVAVRGRLAGRFGTGQHGVELVLSDHVPSTGGLGPGQVSVDELHVEARPADEWRVRVGRMQTRADRMGLLGKSLDRKDSGNTGVTWTDGAHATYSAPGGWTADLIVQRNAGDGPPNVARPPLEYTDPSSRVTVFAAVGSRRAWGPVVQRGLAVTYTPDVLRADGESGSPATDYIGLVARGALQWGMGGSDRRLVLAGEVGYAPNTPTREATGVPGSGTRVGGLAGQVSTTLYDVAPGHHLGVVYGRAEAGWLISPDFRNNGHLVEARYQWRLTGNYSIETRMRWRRDIRQLTGADRPREDVDMYLRLTTSF